METLLLKILNISITASYVIITVVIIRFLLKRTPKKYSYLLWTVVLFRLICPISFSSAFSIFQIKPFVIACAANPMENIKTKENDELYGNYVFETQLYKNPLSSFIASDGYIEYYTLTKNLLIITDETGNQQRFEVAYEHDSVDEDKFKNSFIIDDVGIPDISSYKERYYYTLTSTSVSI